MNPRTRPRLAFDRLAKRVAGELFPADFDVLTSCDDQVLLEADVDTLEIRIVDRASPEPYYGIATLDGRLLSSPQMEDAIRHELTSLRREMLANRELDKALEALK